MDLISHIFVYAVTVYNSYENHGIIFVDNLGFNEMNLLRPRSFVIRAIKFLVLVVLHTVKIYFF